MRPIIIQRVSIDILTVNTCNHPKDDNDEEVKDLDYSAEISKTNLCKWRDIINYPIVFEYKFNSYEIGVLSDAVKLSIISPRVSSLHKEELEDITTRLTKVLPDSEHGWFFRFGRSSPKDGKRELPILSAKEVVEQIVSSVRAMQCMQRGEDILYFCKYDPNWDRQREVRVFIYKGKVTAISQYTERSDFLSLSTDEELSNIARTIDNKISELYPRLFAAFETSNFVCDVYIESPSEVRIIEFNSFGYWLAAGSCHYHWLDDKEILYGIDDIYFRVSNVY